MNDFRHLQESIAEAINEKENKEQKPISKRVLHKLFLKRKKAKKLAKLSRRKNRN